MSTHAARRAPAWLVAIAVAACTSGSSDGVTGVNVASVSITPPTTTLSVGSQVPLQAVVQDASGKPVTGTDVFWSVRDPSVATVSDAGVVTAVAIGSTEVAASSNGKSGVATITVQKTPVASVVVTPPHVDASPGGQAQFSAVAYDDAQNPLPGRTITWSTSNAAVATVDSSGMMKAVGQGTANISATSEGKTGVATVSVSQAPVATVTVSPTPLSMSVGQTTQLAATLKDAAGNVLAGRVVTWSSSNTSVAAVSSSGVVTAVAAGTTTVTATSEGKSGTAAVTISNVAVGSVVVQPQNPTILQGASVQLSATVRDVNGVIVTDRVVTWSSGNATVATVSQSGVVTSVGSGPVTITATCEGKSGSSVVTITAIPVASVTISPPSPDTVFLGYTTQLTAVTKDSAGNVLVGRAITWHSNNPAIASVDANGLVTAVAASSTTITATSEGKTASVTMFVLKAPVGSVVLTSTADSLSIGGTNNTSEQLTATVKDVKGTVVTDRTVLWNSTSPAIANVTPNGSVATVTAKGKGQTKIIAVSETKADTVVVNVVAAVVLIQITTVPANTSLTVAPGATVQLSATCLDASFNPVGRTIQWGSSDSTVATVDASGKVTAKKQGVASITAKAIFDNFVSLTPAVITVTP